MTSRVQILYMIGISIIVVNTRYLLDVVNYRLDGQ